MKFIFKSRFSFFDVLMIMIAVNLVDTYGLLSGAVFVVVSALISVVIENHFVGERDIITPKEDTQ